MPIGHIVFDMDGTLVDTEVAFQLALQETIEQLFVTRAAKTTDRDTVSAMMVYGYDLGHNDDLYFYKEGNYDIIGRAGSRANSLVYIVYHMYDADGELKDVTYDNGGKYYDIEVAREMVADHSSG